MTNLQVLWIESKLGSRSRIEKLVFEVDSDVDPEGTATGGPREDAGRRWIQKGR